MTSERPEFETLPCGILRTAADRTVLHANRYALALLSGTGEDRATGRDVGELVSPATRILLDSYVYPMLLEAGKVEEVQLTLRPSSGEARPVVTNFSLNADRTVDWAFMSCDNRDQLYTELLDTRDLLEGQKAALGQLNARIRERQSDLQAFCHSLSHDFTGPLLNIHRFVDIALEDLRDSGIEAPEELGFLEKARDSAAVLIGMTKGLVEYLVADVPVAHDEGVSLEDVVSTVLSIGVSRDLATPRVTRSALPTVAGNRAQLQVLFTNLLQNAVKYNENDPEITISHTEDVPDGRVVIAVRDNGIGMSADGVDRVFDPFVRLHPSGRYRGSGLGLSIVKKMVTNHGGEIRVDSEPGSGSTFYVTLPTGASTTDGSSGASGSAGRSTRGRP